MIFLDFIDCSLTVHRMSSKVCFPSLASVPVLDLFAAQAVLFLQFLKHSPTMQASRTLESDSGSEDLEMEMALQSFRDRLQGGGSLSIAL